MERFGKLLFFVYMAITWDVDHPSACGGELEFSPRDHLNTTRNCTVYFDCQSSEQCLLRIYYREVNDSGDPPYIQPETCRVANQTLLSRCPKAFSSDSYVWCEGFNMPSNESLLLTTNYTEIIVFDHLDEVQNVHKNDTDCIVWTPPHRDIELQYSIEFMYYDGTIIDNTTSNLAEYCLVDGTFDVCELVSVSIEANAVCGDASSDITWWDGTVLKPSQKKFNISLAIVENDVAINISYTINKTCPSVRASSADLSCWYEIKKYNKTYKLAIHQPAGDYVHLVLHNNKSVVLPQNEIAKCNLTLYNEAGQTEQPIKMISTFPVQNFTIRNPNQTHICMEYQFLNGSILNEECRATLNNTEKNHSFILNAAKSEECYISKPLPNGSYYYCVTCDKVDYCIFTGGPVNITHRSNGGNGNNVGVLVGSLVGSLVAVGVGVGVGVIMYISYRKYNHKNINCFS